MQENIHTKTLFYAMYNHHPSVSTVIVNSFHILIRTTIFLSNSVNDESSGWLKILRYCASYEYWVTFFYSVGHFQPTDHFESFRRGQGHLGRDGTCLVLLAFSVEFSHVFVVYCGVFALGLNLECNLRPWHTRGEVGEGIDDIPPPPPSPVHNSRIPRCVVSLFYFLLSILFIFSSYWTRNVVVLCCNFEIPRLSFFKVISGQQLPKPAGTSSKGEVRIRLPQPCRYMYLIGELVFVLS